MLLTIMATTILTGKIPPVKIQTCNNGGKNIKASVYIKQCIINSSSPEKLDQNANEILLKCNFTFGRLGDFFLDIKLLGIKVEILSSKGPAMQCNFLVQF